MLSFKLEWTGKPDDFQNLTVPQRNKVFRNDSKFMKVTDEETSSKILLFITSHSTSLTSCTGIIAGGVWFIWLNSSPTHSLHLVLNFLCYAFQSKNDFFALLSQIVLLKWNKGIGTESEIVHKKNRVEFETEAYSSDVVKKIEIHSKPVSALPIIQLVNISTSVPPLHSLERKFTSYASQ